MKLYEEVLNVIYKTRDRLKGGKSNCLPFPYKRFSKVFPGLERGSYHIVTGNQKTAKSKWTDYTFLYEPFFYMLEHPDEYKLKVFYYTLEMSPRYKMMEFMCHALYRYTGGEMRYSPRNMKNLSPEYIFPEEALKVVRSEGFRKICDKWEECVEYINTDANPTGINKYIKSYSNNPSHGVLITGDGPVRYEDREPDIIKLIVIDNAANIPTESGYSERENLNKLSKYLIGIRDLLGYSIILIQHQAQAQESVENRKFNSGKPTTSGLGNSKELGRDINMVWGIYSPFKMEKKEYIGYDISKLKNYCRFVEVLEDRDGEATGRILPLYFDGAVSDFDELPRPDDPEMKDAYEYVAGLMNKGRKVNTFTIFNMNKNTEKRKINHRKAIFAFFKRTKLWE